MAKSYAQTRKFVQDAELKTNNTHIAALFRMAKSGGAINMFGKAEMIRHLEYLQRTLERLDSSYGVESDTEP